MKFYEFEHGKEYVSNYGVKYRLNNAGIIQFYGEESGEWLTTGKTHMGLYELEFTELNTKQLTLNKLLAGITLANKRDSSWLDVSPTFNHINNYMDGEDAIQLWIETSSNSIFTTLTFKKIDELYEYVQKIRQLVEDK